MFPIVNIWRRGIERGKGRSKGKAERRKEKTSSKQRAKKGASNDKTDENAARRFGPIAAAKKKGSIEGFATRKKGG